MYAVEVWTALPGGGYSYDVVRCTRLRINRIDEDGHATIMTGTSDWTDEE